ncbi:MAG: DUF4255 domain-containing protein [Chloroflexota bacterium]
MIHDIDESLRALVKQEALHDNGVEVAFDAPTREWVSRRNAPSVDLYLYDIREDLSRRETMWEELRDETGRVTERRLRPRWFRLSYLVTAWTQRPEDEHRLLSAMLSCFIRHETMPPQLLAGTLDGIDLPIVLTAALPPTQDRSIADVWSAMGGELKPSIDLVVTAPMDVERGLAAGPPVLEEPVLSVVQSEPAPKGRARKRKRAAGQASPERDSGIEPGPSGELSETRRAGTRKQPGRTLRVRGI